MSENTSVQKPMKSPEEIENHPVGIYQKIYAVQRFMNRVPKTGNSPHAKYATIYATIDALFPLLHKYGLVCTSESNVRIEDNHVLYTFTTRVIDIESSGEDTNAHVQCTHLFDATQLAKSRDAGDYAQRVGALETYYRRYSLYSIFNMLTYDADGQPASRRETTVKPNNYMNR